MLDLGRLDPRELPAGENVPCLICQAGDGKERRLDRAPKISRRK